MSEQLRIVVFGDPDGPTAQVLEQLKQAFPVLVASDPRSGLAELARGSGVAVVFPSSVDALETWLLQSGGLLEQVPFGIAVLNDNLQILWANERLNVLTAIDESLVGLPFYDAFGTPEILGPDFTPFHTALGSGEGAHSTLRVGDKQYFEVDATPIVASGTQEHSVNLLVVVRDVSNDVLQRQKLNAIYQAGLDLGDLSPQEVMEMTVDERVELLKSKILHYTQDLLEFETVEIRLLNKSTRTLDPLLSVGMEPVASGRSLKAEPQGNGVTGFVAATGKSYLCEDTGNDPLYLSGAPGARSSLTVPLVLHDEIHGTFNVESPLPGAFNENDLQFLELFSREVAIALNTLNLLVVEKATTATESTERVLREVAEPVDEILNDAAWMLERYIGHDSNVCERLQRVLKHTRHIKRLIQEVGRSITPNVPVANLPGQSHRPAMREKRLLVVDGDEDIRRAAREILGRHGCDVETSSTGQEAFLMVRSFHYDAVLIDIRLPDMDGFTCFKQLRELNKDLPIIFMTGFGYDGSHSIVKARPLGLQAVLYKPFRLNQLLTEVEKALSVNPAQCPPAATES